MEKFFSRFLRPGFLMVLVALVLTGGMRAEAASGAQATGPQVPQSASPRFALVIGNGDYRDFPKLIGAVADADLMAQALTARGFSVVKAANVKREAMTALLAQFEQTLARQGGVGVFYFSGQAVHVGGEDVMFPVDARVPQGASALQEGINLAQIQREIQSSGSRGWRDNGVVTIYAASKGQLAFDSLPGQKNSPFAMALASALQQPGSDVHDVFQRVRDGVEAAFRDPKLQAFKQTPDISGQFRERFFFNQPDRDPVGSVSRILLLDASRDNPFTNKPGR